MKSFVICNPINGEIESIGICKNVEELLLQIKENKVLIESNATHLTHYYFNNELIAYTPEQSLAKSNKPNPFCNWSNATFSWEDSRSQETINLEKIALIKNTRNALLTSSDWTQIPNNALSTEQQQAWASYRQQLRDITSQSGYPITINWPTPPQG